MGKINQEALELLRQVGAKGALMLLGLVALGGEDVRLTPLSRAMGMTEKTVRRALAQLRTMGLVKFQKGWCLDTKARTLLMTGSFQEGEPALIPQSQFKVYLLHPEDQENHSSPPTLFPDLKVLAACMEVGIRNPIRSILAVRGRITAADVYSANDKMRVELGEKGSPAIVGIRLMWQARTAHPLDIPIDLGQESGSGPGHYAKEPLKEF